MTIDLDKAKVTKLFLYLKEGKFLSQNSPSKSEKALFAYLEHHFETLHEYFSYIDIELVLGNGYAYFASSENKEKRLEQIYELIDYLNFFYNYSPMFDVGFHFLLSDIEEKLKENLTLDLRLKKIKTISGDTLHAKLRSLVSKLEKRGFIGCEDEYLQSYVVLNSFTYLTAFYDAIEIKE
ncbi:hypothetical protein [Sulfurimonas sp.]|uniref:condensin complex protein MksE n=1 Tax=Sulfurimonas sp. TaxID=2022749 RepID=UPI002604AE4B|nr:hypothetical protein [Sulfurimonas sp.]